MTRNKIGFSAAISLVIANMIGVGIFTSLGFQLSDLSNYYTILLLWILGGLHAILGSFCYSELSAAFPKSGGEYHFLSLSYGKFIGFLSGWTSATLGFAAPIAATAHAFAMYFCHFYGTGLNPKYISTIIILLITFVHCLNIKKGATFQILFSFGKVLLILFFIGAGLYVCLNTDYKIQVSSFNFNRSIIYDFFNPGFWIGLIFVSYAYSGWNASSYLIDEIKNPKKNVPASIIWGTIIVTILYVSLNFIFLISTPAAALKGKEDIAHIVAISLFGNKGAIIISSVISFLLISTISSMIMVGPRVIKRISMDYKEFAFFSTNSKNDVPIRAILLLSGISLIILFTGGFQFIVTCIGFVLCIFTTLTSISVIILRIKKPTIERPIKTPFYPVMPILFSLFNIWMMTYLIINRPMESITGLIFVAIGGLIYFLFNIKSKAIAPLFFLITALFLFSCNEKNNSVNKNSIKIVDSNTINFNIDSSFDTKATLLAGLDSNNALVSKSIINQLNKSWEFSYKGILSPINKWIIEEKIDTLTKGSNFLVFYPFSGPDFAYANSFYPDAQTYILAGLEKSGNLSSNIFSKSTNDSGFLINAEKYFYFSSKMGFFRTLDMEKQFQEKGVVDILAFYLKRMKCEIGEIKLLRWDNNKMALKEDNQNSNVCYFKFKQPSGKVSEMYYFSKNISNEALASDTCWLKWVEKKATNQPIVSLTKSASYLMCVSSFSTVRNFILNNSKAHIQDDSGIGYDFILNSNRRCKLYGSYSNVIPLFNKFFQKNLFADYQKDSSIKKLQFKIGYNLRYNETNLQLVY